jgi:hypothetical protein
MCGGHVDSSVDSEVLDQTWVGVWVALGGATACLGSCRARSTGVLLCVPFRMCFCNSNSNRYLASQHYMMPPPEVYPMAMQCRHSVVGYVFMHVQGMHPYGRQIPHAILVAGITSNPATSVSMASRSSFCSFCRIVSTAAHAFRVYAGVT